MTKKGKIVLFSILGIAAVSTGAYFFWKKNNKKTPVDKELGTDKPVETFTENSEPKSTFKEKHPVAYKVAALSPVVAVSRLVKARKERKKAEQKS